MVSMVERARNEPDESKILTKKLRLALANFFNPFLSVEALTGIQLMGHICPRAGDKLPTDHHYF
jgi:hypothetical protein